MGLDARSSGTGAGLEVEGLRRAFGDVQALNGLDLTVRRGRVVGFLGPNGAGKTTAMRCIAGIVIPETGTIRFDGRPLDRATRQQIGYMPEERGLYPKMGLRDQLVYFGRLHGRSAAAAGRNAEAWLDRLGLSGRGAEPIEALSHGNQQRAQLAVALAHEPDILLLDEPFAGLDPVGVEALAEVLREQAGRGAAVLFSSHQLDLVQQFCDDVAIVDRGRLVVAGALEAVRRSRGRRVLEVGVEAPAEAWLPQATDVHLLDRTNGTVRLSLGERADAQAILDLARAQGPLTSFREVLPSLSDVFRETVAGR